MNYVYGRLAVYRGIVVRLVNRAGPLTAVVFELTGVHQGRMGFADLHKLEPYTGPDVYGI